MVALTSLHQGNLVLQKCITQASYAKRRNTCTCKLHLVVKASIHSQTATMKARLRPLHQVIVCQDAHEVNLKFQSMHRMCALSKDMKQHLCLEAPANKSNGVKVFRVCLGRPTHCCKHAQAVQANADGCGRVGAASVGLPVGPDAAE